MNTITKTFLDLCGPSPDPGYLYDTFSPQILAKAKEQIWTPVERRILNQIVLPLIGYENTTKI